MWFPRLLCKITRLRRCMNHKGNLSRFLDIMTTEWINVLCWCYLYAKKQTKWFDSTIGQGVVIILLIRICLDILRKFAKEWKINNKLIFPSFLIWRGKLQPCYNMTLQHDEIVFTHCQPAVTWIFRFCRIFAVWKCLAQLTRKGTVFLL